MNIPINSQVVNPSHEGKFIEKLTKVYNTVKADMPMFEEYDEKLNANNMLYSLLDPENKTYMHPLTKVFTKDCEIINVDIENFKAYNIKKTSDGVEYVLIRMGGDWEIPVYFIVYFDKDEVLRSFLSYKGNMFNFDDMCAFGENLDGSDVNVALKHFSSVVKPFHEKKDVKKFIKEYLPAKIDESYIDELRAKSQDGSETYKVFSYIIDGIIYGLINVSPETIEHIPCNIMEEMYVITIKAKPNSKICVEDFIEQYGKN